MPVLLAETIKDFAKLCRRDEAVVVLVKIVEGLLNRRDLRGNEVMNES